MCVMAETRALSSVLAVNVGVTPPLVGLDESHPVAHRDGQGNCKGIGYCFLRTHRDQVKFQKIGKRQK